LARGGIIEGGIGAAAVEEAVDAAADVIKVVPDHLARDVDAIGIGAVPGLGIIECGVDID
jgi:hypothetical protein